MIAPTEWVDQLSARLPVSEHIDNPARIARRLLCFVSGKNESWLLMNWNKPCLDTRLLQLSETLAIRIAHGEPVQYIVGYQGFWKSLFSVGPGVLVPRPETELLVETMLKVNRRHRRIAELGAGSGNIGISCLQESPELEWYAWEISPTALGFAQKNAKALLNLGMDHYHLHLGDFFEDAGNMAPWDVIVSNPPYVARGEMKNFSAQVNQEPSIALDGGDDGLEIIQRLLQYGARNLVAGGTILIEIAQDQGDACTAIATNIGYDQKRVIRDLVGNNRVFVASTREGKPWTPS